MQLFNNVVSTLCAIWASLFNPNCWRNLDYYVVMLSPLSLSLSFLLPETFYDLLRKPSVNISLSSLPSYCFRESEIVQEQARVSPFDLFQQQEGNSCSDGQLSGVMPDVAMATASFGALQLIEEQELELDLGDGASHLMPPHVSPSSGSIEAHRSSLPHQHQRHFSGPPPPPYVYHRAGTALPRFIWNLYTICGSEQRGNYWFPFASSPPLVSCSFHRRHPTRCTLLYSPLCNVYRSNLVIAGTNLLQTRIIVCTFFV